VSPSTSPIIYLIAKQDESIMEIVLRLVIRKEKFKSRTEYRKEPALGKIVQVKRKQVQRH
jgi:hypothetical protein